MNLFALPPAAPGEVAEPLWENSAFRLERIVSRGDVSPAGFWYDQEETEWVSLLSGCALLESFFWSGGTPSGSLPIKSTGWRRLR